MNVFLATGSSEVTITARISFKKKEGAGVEPLESRRQTKLLIHTEKMKKMPDHHPLHQKLKDPTKTDWKGEAWTT